jgi:hypothetical protein
LPLPNGRTDCRVKPGNDGGEVERAQRSSSDSLPVAAATHNARLRKKTYPRALWRDYYQRAWLG